jgi:hypothetical protein
MYLRAEIPCCTLLVLLVLLAMTRYRLLENGDISALSLIRLSKPANSIVMNKHGDRIQATINDILYLVDKGPVIGASTHIRGQEIDSFIPATVINVERLLIDKEWLKSELNRMVSKDDVFNLGFTSLILFNCGTGKIKVTSDAGLYLNSIGTSWFGSLHTAVKVPSGPYIWHLDHIFKVWRLYSDPNGAFIQPVIQSSTEVDRYVVNRHGTNLYTLLRNTDTKRSNPT